MTYWYLLPALAVCIVFSAFFSASEIVFGSVNRLHLNRNAEKGNKKASDALRLADNYGETISTILVGNNLVNICASSMASLVANELFGPVSGPTVAMLGMTVIILIFGEILPKTLSVKKSYKLSLAFAFPLNICKTVMKPVVFAVSQFVKKISFLWTSKNKEHTTDEELFTIVDAIEQNGGFDEKKGDLVRSAIDFREVEVHEIMIPRVDVVAMDINDDISSLYNNDVIYNYSSIPVYEGNIDEIIGVLPTKTLLRKINSGEKTDIRELLYQPIFVHKSKPASELLSEFRKQGVHIAVVVDEFGGMMGILTMEDILEELVGDIWDEMDIPREEYVESESGVYTVDGDMNIYDLFDLTDYDAKDFESDYNTVGGFALEKLGGMPAPAINLILPI